jgi:hypothetical protein
LRGKETAGSSEDDMLKLSFTFRKKRPSFSSSSNSDVQMAGEGRENIDEASVTENRRQ